MALVPKSPADEHRPRRPLDWKGVIKPEGKFVRKINPEDMKPILPEMPYIPPQ